MTEPVTKSFVLSVLTAQVLAKWLDGPEALILANACYAIGRSVTDASGNVKRVEVHLTNEQRETICSRLMDVLATSGLQADWEVNDFGRQIEDLIDVFNPFE